MLNRSDFGSHLSQVATPNTESSTSGLVLGGNHAHDVDGSQQRNRRVLASLNQWHGLRDDVVVILLPLLVHHDEFGNEDSRLAGPVRDLVIEVMNLLASLARNLDRPDPQRLEREIEHPDAFLVARNERRIHELHVEHIAVLRNRNRPQIGNEHVPR